MEKHWPPLIVAMKGHPGTGKTTLARAISASLRLPLLDKDDIRDCTLPLQAQHQLPSSPLNDLSYSVLWQITQTQLQLGLSVVIDSPLSRRAHLDELIQLARGRVVVVECRPKDEGEWRRRLEERGRTGGARGHKPATWEELERLVEGYGGCWDYDVGDVKRIVVDTTAAEDDQQRIVDTVVDFVKSSAAL